jgi:hypothetical protein
MGDKASAFGKGGCGCLIVFAVLALFTVLCGGTAHIDLGGAIALFVIGGIIGLIINAIYSKGRRDQDYDNREQ